MAQPDFPTLSPAQEADHDSFRQTPAYGPTGNSEFEGGTESSRSRHTHVPWLWTFRYLSLSTANKETIVGFWETTCACGQTVFHWTNPTNSTAYFVRFASQPRAELMGDGTGTWRVDLQLKEALGSFT